MANVVDYVLLLNQIRRNNLKQVGGKKANLSRLSEPGSQFQMVFV